MVKRLPGSRPDFRNLWSRLRAAYSIAGKPRMVAVLDNFRDQKESICRKLNVVCDSDVNRIAEELKSNRSLPLQREPDRKARTAREGGN